MFPEIKLIGQCDFQVSCNGLETRVLTPNATSNTRKKAGLLVGVIAETRYRPERRSLSALLLVAGY